MALKTCAMAAGHDMQDKCDELTLAALISSGAQLRLATVVAQFS